MKTLIKDVHIYNREAPCDLLIEAGKIAAVGQDIDSAGATVVNGAGLTALPGLVDLHCHLREPGFEYKDDLEHSVRSAAVGGFTDICCMPNTNPVNDGKTVTHFLLSTSRLYPGARVHPIAAASVGLKGELLTEMFDLREHGAVAFSDDGAPISSPSFMRKALTYAKMTGLPLMNHAEELSLSKGGQMNEGITSTILGLKGYPAIAEEIMIDRDLRIAEYVGGQLHVCHVSTATGVAMIRQAKARGVRVTAEATPHHFSLTEEACLGYNTLAKVSPPLRTEADRKAIVAGLADGTLDAIATDHAPHHPDEKNQEFDVAAKGLVGFETAFGLAVTHLLKPGHLTLPRLVELLCHGPRRIVNLPAMDFEVGDPADLVLCDLNCTWTVDPAVFESRAKNTPFGGHTLTGRAMTTFVGGRQLTENAQFIG